MVATVDNAPQASEHGSVIRPAHVEPNPLLRWITTTADVCAHCHVALVAENAPQAANGLSL